ncbi:FG-GAP-like repeat-containing protein [Streptomyces omiyaensis]|uniref:FG-GAP-like repeat-containing protein n=1 Tax=Streptomyces omiyaensis TaxID=68247 RepID=UPI0016756B02|nr:FG-GAP-like repeat-containing protein [Streptomyces omiyaensis]
MLRRGIRVLAALLAAAALTAVIPAHAQAAAGDPVPVKRQLTVLTWNICGETLVLRGRTGYCPHRADVKGKALKVAELARKYQADVIMLQEVCGYEGDIDATPRPHATPVPNLFPGANSKSHMAFLQEDLKKDLQEDPENEWTVRHAVGSRADGESYCRNSTLEGYGEIGGSIGVLLAVKGTMHDVRTIETTTGTSLERSIPALCGRLVGWPDQLCTTHLIAGNNTVQRAQTAEIKKQLGTSWTQGTLIGGDFNGDLGDPDLTDVQEELDACETNTFTHQTWAADNTTPQTWNMDHLFASKLSAGTRWTSCLADHEAMDKTKNLAGTEPDGWSDHAPVVATLRQTPVPGDMTGDGKPDLVAVDKDGKLRLYPGTGTGALAAPLTIGNSGWTGASLAHRGDWNGDGTEDLLARVGNELRVYPNQGDGTLTRWTTLHLPLPATAQVAAVGDLDLDGAPDAVVSYDDRLYRYDGIRGTSPSVAPPVKIGSEGWADQDITGLGDADHDGRPDLLTRQHDGPDVGKLWLRPGLADGTFAAPTQYGYGYTAGSRPLLSAAADADGDGVADLWATTGDGTGRLLYYQGSTDAAGNPTDGPSTEVGTGGWNTVITALG